MMRFVSLTNSIITPKYEPITSEYLDYDEVMEKFNQMMDYVAKIYIKALNAIHICGELIHEIQEKY